MNARVAAVTDAFRTQLWPIPAIGIVLGLLVGVLLPELDGHIDEGLPSSVSRYLFGGGPSAARTLLGAVASSLITVTSLTFSLTVVTLQLASGQFSPRLLRTFTRDRFVHVTLGLFLGTFVYALAVLRTVRTGTDGDAAFVPQVAVSVGFVLCIASVLGLVLFLAHLASEIRVETMLRTVHREAGTTLERVCPPRDSSTSGPDAPQRPTHAADLLAPGSGFLLGVDARALLSAAVAAGAVLMLDRAPGDSLVAGVPVGAVWPLEGQIDDDDLSALRVCARGALRIGYERTEAQDVGYGLQQLVDVAAKALSPGVNDPTTAVHAIGHLSALLCQLAGRDLGAQLLGDDHERVRVVLRRPSFTDLLELAVGQIRRYGAADPVVLGRLFALLQEVAWVATGDLQRRAVRSQLRRLRTTVRAQDLDADELEQLDDRATLVERALAGEWISAGRLS